MNDQIFLIAAVVTAGIQALTFWSMAWRRGVLGAFGKRPLSWGGLAGLTLCGCVPALCVCVLLGFHDSAFDDAVEIKVAALGAVLNLIGLEVIKWLGARITVPVHSEIKKINSL